MGPQLSLVKSALKLLRLNRDTISKNPLHLYISSLPLFVQNSPLYQAYNANNQSPTLGVLKGRTEQWSPAVQFSIHRPDKIKSCMFSSCGNLFAAKFSDYLQVWVTRSGSSLLSVMGRLVDASFLPSPHSDLLAYQDGLGNTIEFWDVRAGICTRKLDLQSGFVGDPVVISPNGKTLAGYDGSRIRVWSMENGQEQQSILVGDHPQDLSFSSDGQRLVCSVRNEVRVWRFTMEPGSPSPTIFPTSLSPSPVFSPHDPNLLAYLLDSQTLVLQNLTSPSQTRHLKMEEGEHISCFVFSNEGSKISAGSDTGVVTVWRTTANCDSEVVLVRSYNEVIRSLALSPDGARLAVASGTLASVLNLGSSISNTTIHRQWKVADGPVENKIIQLLFSPDGNTLALVTPYGHPLLWDMEDAQTYSNADNVEPLDHMQRVEGASIFGTKPFAITGSDDKVRIWDAETGESLRVFDEFSRESILATSTSDKFAILDPRHGELRVMNATNSQDLTIFNIEPADQPYALGLAPDGSLLAMFLEDQRLRIWTSAAQASQASFDLDSNVQCAEISPDASVAVWATGHAINLWDMEGGVVSATLPNDSGGRESLLLTAIALSAGPSAITIGMCTSNSEVIIWEPHNVENPGPWTTHHLYRDPNTWTSHRIYQDEQEYLSSQVFYMHFPNATQILAASRIVITLFQLNSDHSPTARTSSFSIPQDIWLDSISPINDTSSTYILTVWRRSMGIYGLMAVKMNLGSPNPPVLQLCWFPSDIEVTYTSVKDYRVVLGCKSGEVLILDVSGIQKYGF